MISDELSFFEKRLTAELEAIELRISELQRERHILRRQVAKAAAEREGLQFTTRKNSMNRVLAENSVIATLRRRGVPVKTKELYINARSTNYDLKETTFRSYLHRMKNAGIIKTVKHAGQWGLTDDERKNDLFA